MQLTCLNRRARKELAVTGTRPRTDKDKVSIRCSATIIQGSGAVGVITYSIRRHRFTPRYTLQVEREG